VLAILPGQGVGPIRFGATIATIERLMEAPCEVKTDRLCRYLERAVEFELEDGKTRRIRVHRRGRFADRDPSDEYGVFNGAIPPDLRFGMLPWAIQEHLGKPQRVEPVTAPNDWSTLERHFYPGMILEYDRLPNGNAVLGGVILEPGGAPG
jgi:hypothetical protein